jgi:cytochrome c biogenesis protein CcmG/thiol:disulfide interchange protein DsbE
MNLPAFGCLLVAAVVLVAPLAHAVDAGQPAPALKLATATGESITLDALRGKVVYVDFWASWCGPCRRSFPWMNTMQQKYGPRGFTVVAVNVDKKRADAERFLANIPGNFTIVYDEAGVTPGAWGVKGMPSSYLVDQRGNVVFVERGFLDEQAAAVEERVQALLAKN